MTVQCPIKEEMMNPASDWVPPPPQGTCTDSEMAWVIAQSLGTAFLVGGLTGALLAYSFSKSKVVDE